MTIITGTGKNELAVSVMSITIIMSMSITTITTMRAASCGRS